MFLLRAMSVVALTSVSVVASTLSLNTGLDGSGNLLSTNGAADAHWVINNSSIVANGTAAMVIQTNASPDWFSGWAADGPNSDWVAANAGASDQGNVPWLGEVDFYLTAASVASASISVGTFGVD